MGWSIGFDEKWKRDIGYGVPAFCDHPECATEIDRGLSYVCCDSEPHGGERGCGLYFCYAHRDCDGRCQRCATARGRKKGPFDPKPDAPEWIAHKLTDESWAEWRAENPEIVTAMLAADQAKPETP